MLYFLWGFTLSCFQGYLPNSNLAVEAMLATASLGAIWSSTSPDFGVTVSLNMFVHVYSGICPNLGVCNEDLCTRVIVCHRACKKIFWVCCFFLLQGVLDRFTQIKPKVIFSVEAVQYNGRKHDHLTKLRSVVEGLPDLTRVVIQPFCCEGLSVDISSVPKRYA